MADEVASLLVRITADGSQAVGVLNGVSSTVTTLASKNASLMNKISATGQLAGSAGRTMTKTFGVATIAGLVASAKAAGQLNKELANIGTLSVPTERLKEYKGQIQDIAIATAKSTSDISEGTYQVVSAFGDTPDTMKKVEINAKAATAGLATTADSIALTSAVTKAYGDTSAAATQRVADLAFKTVELGQTTFPELAQSMQQVTSLSKELGVSQEELFGAYATLTGVTGNAAEVQTQMKAVYTALLKPSENMEAAILKLGYSSGYSMIKTLGFAGTLKALKSVTNGSEEQMLGLFNNVRAMPAVMALTGAQADVFSEKLEKMENASGAATKAFEVQTEGVAKTGFTLEQAKVKLQVAAQNFGERAAPMIADFADIVDSASTKLASLSDEERQAIINTGVLTTKIGVGLAVGGKALTIGTKLAGTIKTIGEVIPTINALSGVSASSFLAATPALAPAVVVGTYRIIAEYVTEAIENNSKLGQSYKELYDTWAAADENAENITKLRDEYEQLQSSIDSGNLNSEQLESAKARTSEIMEQIKELVNDDTIKLMIDTGDYETALDLAVSEAKSAATEIRNELDLSDYKNAQKAVSEGYDAVNKGGTYRTDYKEQQKEMSAWLRQAAEFETQYSGIMRNMQSASAQGNGKWLQSLAKIRADLIQTVQDNGFADTYEKITGNVFKFEDMNGIIEQIQNIKNAYEGLTQNISSMDERAENGRKSLQAMAQVAQNSAISLNGYNNIQEVFEAGSNAVNNTIMQLKSNMSEWGFTNEDIAAQIALFRNGYDSLQGAIDNNAIDAVISNFTTEAQQLGLASEDIIVKSALMKSGFSDIQQAITSGNINGVVNSLGSFGSDMGMTIEQINAIARGIGLIPENKHIEITADGYEVVEGAIEKLKEFGNENVHISVNAEGDISVLNEATGRTQNLVDIGAVFLAVNADGNIDVLNQAGEKVAEVDGSTAQITVNTEVDSSEEEEYNPDNKDAEVKYTIDTTEPDGYIPENKTAYVNYVATGDVPRERAKGDMNFPGGLAMVNDQTGIADNRELIIDRGRAFIPEGRNVVLPLSKGAKVYTAAQTKAIMSGLGIPRYAEGKNNSDAFTSARDNWSHYTKTHSVTTAQELQKWLEFQKQYAENEKDIWDIEEQVFSLQQKITKELNDQSKAYIEERSALNDWSEYGDSAIAAFERVKDRNKQELDAGRITWQEYVDNISSIGSSMYSERIDQSKNWLEHETDYNGLTSQSYIEGLQRMAAYTTEYFQNGIISYREYAEGLAEINDNIIDKTREANAAEYAAWQKDAGAWEELRSTYGDWDKYGDSEEAFIKRKIQRVRDFYAAGTIGFEELIDDTNRYSMDLYKAQESIYDDMLKKQQDYISDMRDTFQKQEQELRDSWTIADRKADMSDVQNQLTIYAGAVTDAGMKKYAELEKQFTQLQRDDELYNLQVKNNSIIEGLEAEYAQMEDMKTDVLRGIAANIDINVSDIVGGLTANIQNMGSDITNLLSQLVNKFDNFQIEQSYYTDNSQTTINAADSVDITAVMRKRASLH